MSFLKNKAILIFVSVEGGGAEINIHPYSADGKMYVFLPSFADMSRVSVHTDRDVYIGGQHMTDGYKCSGLELDKEYDLVINNVQSGSIRFIRSENIASMHIDTISGSMDKIYKDINYKERVSVRVVNNTGEISYSGNDDRLKGRGNSTWRDFDKKPLSLDLKMPSGLLGMDAGKDWALLANSKDLTNIKNKLVYDLSKDLGLCAPDSEFVDLYLNGEYNGLYLLSEKPESVFDKINDNEESYLFLRDWGLKKFKYGFLSDTGQPIGIKHPSECSDETVQRLKNNIKGMEESISSENGFDKTGKHQWTDYIDIDSWAKKYLVEEVFANTDCVFGSQYFYWAPDDGMRMKAGPVWDYDGVLSTPGKNKNPGYFYCNRTAVNNAAKAMYWYDALYDKKEFYDSLTDIYKKEFSADPDKIGNEIDRLAGYTAQSSSMDALRWPGQYNGVSVALAVDNAKAFLSEHMRFLNNAWIDNIQYHTIIFDRELDPAKSFFSYAYYTAEDGKGFADMPENSKLGVPEDTVWCNKKTGEVFDPDKAVTEDITLCIKHDNAVSETKDKGSSKTAQLRSLLKTAVICGPIAVLCIVLIILVIADIRKRGKRRE